VAVVEDFGPEYMRLPNEQDTARFLAIGASRGFSGMLGSCSAKALLHLSCFFKSLSM
jgi:hypothetical protein